MDFSLETLLQSWSILFSSDPLVFVPQIFIIALGVIAVYLVFFATRDIIQRSQSLVVMMLCILLVALLPLVGFLLYLLVRPARTTKERELEQKIDTILSLLKTKKPAKKSSKKAKE